MPNLITPLMLQSLIKELGPEATVEEITRLHDASTKTDVMIAVKAEQRSLADIVSKVEAFGSALGYIVIAAIVIAVPYFLWLPFHLVRAYDDRVIAAEKAACSAPNTQGCLAAVQNEQGGNTDLAKLLQTEYILAAHGPLPYLVGDGPVVVPGQVSMNGVSVKPSSTTGVEIDNTDEGQTVKYTPTQIEVDTTSGSVVYTLKK
jgi:hypothetical protein